MSKHKNYLDSVFEKINKTTVNEAKSKEKKDEKIDGYESEVYDYLKQQEEFIEENEGLYKVFNSIDNIIANENEFQRIQTVDSKVDVNNKRVIITATTKVDDLQKDMEILELFVNNLKNYNKEAGKFKYDYEISEMNLGENDMGGEGKLILTMEIS